MQKPRPRPKRRRVQNDSAPPFAFDDHARLEIAKVLRPHQDVRRRQPEVIRQVIEALEGCAREFVESTRLAPGNNDTMVREAVQQLLRTVTRSQDAIRALPARARDALTERLLMERGIPAGTLEQARTGMALIRYAAIRVLSDLAPNPNGGQPVQHRKQQLAADTALILSEQGIQASKYAAGTWAEILVTIFDAVKHPSGDIPNLLAKTLARYPDLEASPKRPGGRRRSRNR